jgi:hypothetical protein
MTEFANYIQRSFRNFIEITEFFESKNFEVICNDSEWMISGDFSQISEMYLSGSESPEFCKALLQARGTILTIQTNEIVCIGLPYPIEYHVGQSFPCELSPDDITCVPALQGTLTVLFYWNGSWCLSSSSHINVLPTSIGRNLERSIWEVTGDKTPLQQHPLIQSLHKSSCYYFIVSELHGVTHIGSCDKHTGAFYSHRIPEFDSVMYHCFTDMNSLFHELRYCPDVEYVLVYPDCNVGMSTPVYRITNPHHG